MEQDLKVEISQQQIKIPPLSSYYVYLTEGCNLACRHCWLAPAYQPKGGTGGHLDFQLLALAIEEGLPLGLHHIKLTGGEPLLHPDFIKIIDLLREKNLQLTIETNGILMTETLARYLKEKSTLGLISVSLDGSTAETHDAFRGVKGAFDKACNAVKYLAEAGYHPQVIMTLHRGNLAETESLIQLAQDLGAGSVKLGLVQPSGRGELMIEKQEVLEFQEQVEIGKWVNNELQKKYRVMIYFHWPMAFFSLKQLLHSAGFTCQVFNILGILPNGQMAMCGIGTQESNLCYGLFGKDKLADVWSTHPVLIQLRETLPGAFEGVCGECILKGSCLATCVAENYHLTGKLTAPYQFCEIADKMGLFPMSRKASKIDGFNIPYEIKEADHEIQ